MKDKQIDKALMKVKKVGLKVVEKFKASNEYLDKLCNYYVEGFDLFWKYLAKHHSELDFFKLDMEEMEKEILVNHPIEAMVENKVVLGVAENVLTDPSPSSLPWKFLLFVPLFLFLFL